jgi:broad specificity phosphatase PhoE
VPGDVTTARLEWERAQQELEDASRDPGLEETLRAQVEAISDQLRRRVGGTFTLAELADEYGQADAWARDTLSEQGAPRWPRTLAMVEGAAFHQYSRGASDYTP